MKYYDWIPGNGSRYKFFVEADISSTVISSKNGAEYGTSPYSYDSILLTWMNPGISSGKSMVVATQSYLHYSYVMEKLNIESEADTAAILAFLNKFYDVEVGMPVFYCSETGLFQTDDYPGNEDDEELEDTNW